MNLRYDIADGVAVEMANFGGKLNLPGSDEFRISKRQIPLFVEIQLKSPSVDTSSPNCN